MEGIHAVAVEDGRDLVLGADAAGSALAEVIAGLDVEGLRHGGLLWVIVRGASIAAPRAARGAQHRRGRSRTASITESGLCPLPRRGDPVNLAPPDPAGPGGGP
ncbi:hypothetical protein GCM10027268_00150 [Brachybacterium huguangmaarense]